MTPVAAAESVRATELQGGSQAGATTGADASLPVDGVPRHVVRHLAGGTSALAAAVMAERGMGFAANILAARLGGTSTFGAYSLAITTAASISTYAAGGIGATAARFSGKYPYGTEGYTALARALGIVSIVSAALAGGALWFGAAPLAHLLGKPGLTPLLRWAAFSAAGMLLLECARGFFIGQRRLRALLLLSLVVGVGILALLPLAAAHGSPVRMVLSQAVVTVGAVSVCLLLARRLGLRGLPATGALPVCGILREVWTFGMVQLAGLAGMNLAGWWLTTLVARADTSLVQMSFFAVGSQLRNIVGLGPSLLTESSYAIMARSDEAAPQTPDQVMALCTYLSTGSALLLSSLGMVAAPYVLHLLYGHAYAPAAAATALGLAVAVVHMGNSPAAARLTILSIRTTGVINTVWAIFVAAAGTVLLLGRNGGSAAVAMTVYLLGHLLSTVMVLGALRRHRAVPQGMTAVVLLGSLTAVALAGLAWTRGLLPAHAAALSLGMLALLAAALTALARLGRQHHWLPSAAVARELFASLRARLLPRMAGGSR